MNKQKTAVDLFLGEIIPLTINCVPSIDLFECWKRAKKMEKEQIINAWMGKDTPLQRMVAEKYYNETYGE